MILTEMEYEVTIATGGQVTRDYGKQEFRQCPVCRSYVWTGTVVKPNSKWSLKHMTCYICAQKRENRIIESLVGKKYHCKINYKNTYDGYEDAGYRIVTVDFDRKHKVSRFDQVMKILHKAGFTFYETYRGPGEYFAHSPYGFKYGGGMKWIVKQFHGRDV